MTKTIADRIGQRLDELGISPHAASLKAGGSPSLIPNILNGRSANPRADTLEKIADALSTTSEWLLTGRDDTQLLSGNEVALALDTPDRPVTSNRKVPVLGTVSGSLIKADNNNLVFEGFEMDAAPIDHAAHPPGIESQKGIYAVYVVGDSMDPMHPPGDIRFVQPFKPAAPGDTVIVQTKHWDGDPGQAYIKLYRRRAGGVIILEQINPQATLKIPQEFVVAMHRVVPNNELWGV